MKKPIIDDFVSHEKITFKWYIGKLLASSLSGFIAGIIVGAFLFSALFFLILKWNQTCS
jgi:hypothetical protein